MYKLQSFAKLRTLTGQPGSMNAKTVPGYSKVWFSLTEARFHLKIWKGKI